MLKHLKQGRGFYRGALSLMLPMIIQNFISNFMGLADTFMVGALGEIELAAVTMANSVFVVLGLIVFGIQSGTSVLVAQYHGRGNLEAINRILGVGFYVSVSVTTLVAFATGMFPREIMGVLTNNADLIEPGSEYMRIAGWSYVCMAISGVYISVHRSMENPKLGAWLLSVSGVMNIFLNYMLIFGKFGAPMLGCAGAAIATLISRVFEVIVIVIYASRTKLLPLKFSLLLRPGKVIARDFAKYSVPVVMNEGLWSLAISLYSVIMGHMPNNTPILAAYTIAGNLDRLLAVGLFAAGNAAAVIIGRDIGRGDSEGLQSKGIALNALCVGAGLITMVFLQIVRLFLADSLIFPLVGLSAESGEIAKYMLLVISILMPLRAFNLCNIVGVFRGGGDVRFSLMCDVIPMYLLCVPAAAIFALVFGHGIEVVYICMCVDDIIKSIMCVPRLLSGKWINNVTRDVLT